MKNITVDLACDTGLADRLIDLWAACCIARLHGAHLACTTHPGSKAGWTYDFSRISVAGCAISEVSTPGPGWNARVEKGDRLRGNTLTLHTNLWGTLSPSELYSHRHEYDLADFDLDQFVRAYEDAAQSTRMRTENMLDGASIGIHVRAGDKLKKREKVVPWEQTEQQFIDISRLCMNYLRCHADELESCFICGDDPHTIQTITDLCAELGIAPRLSSEETSHDVPTNGPLEDMMTLSRCGRVLQVSRYTGFSVAAALIGARQLLNMDELAGTAHSYASRLWGAQSFLDTRPFKLHVASAHWNEDLDWLLKLPQSFSFSVCDKRENPEYAGTGDCDVDRNFGYEASAYLAFIVAHYDALPRKVAFVHGHETAWHQKDSMTRLLRKAMHVIQWHPEVRFLSLNDPLRCNIETDEHRHWADEHWKRKYAPFYDTLIGPYVQSTHAPPTGAVTIQCCAQFIVDSSLIKRFPLRFYEGLLRYFTSDRCSHHNAVAMEYLWEYLFTGNHKGTTDDCATCSKTNLCYYTAPDARTTTTTKKRVALFLIVVITLLLLAIIALFISRRTFMKRKFYNPHASSVAQQ